jgi:hypothetical protein
MPFPQGVKELMKLFFIRSQESDYLQDSLYAGFCQKLGQENVFEYPWDFSKHLKTKVYPRNLNQLSHPSFWRDLRQRFDFNFLKEADLVVVASAKPSSTLRVVLSPKTCTNTKKTINHGTSRSYLFASL